MKNFNKLSEFESYLIKTYGEDWIKETSISTRYTVQKVKVIVYLGLELYPSNELQNDKAIMWLKDSHNSRLQIRVKPYNQPKLMKSKKDSLIKRIGDMIINSMEEEILCS